MSSAHPRPGTPQQWPEGAGAPPSGRVVRRWTRHRARRREPARLADLLTDVYMAVLALTLTVAITLGGAEQLGAELAARPASGGGLDPVWLVLLAALAVVAALTGLAARLGPVGLAPARAAWWLPLPVERRGLLRPAVLLWPAVGAGAGAVLGLGLALVGRAPAAVLASAAVAGAALTAAAVCGTGLAQVSERAHRRVRRVADGVLGLAPAIVLALAMADVPAPDLTPASVHALAGAAAALLLITVLLLDRRLGRLSDRGLRERGAVAGEALGAALSVDTRALGRALTAAAEPARRRSRSMRWLARTHRMPRPGGRSDGGAGPRRRPAPLLAPALALLTAEALSLARGRRHLVQLLAAACLPALAVAVAAPQPVLVALLLAAASYLAASATAESARRAEAAPALDALLPLGALEVRLLRLVVPVLVHGLWSAGVYVLLAWRLGADEAAWSLWAALGVLASFAWVAGGLRAAYRPPPDFSGGLVHTPMGSFSPGAASVLLRGPDVALLCAIPAFVAVLLGRVTSSLLAVQAVLALVAVLVVSLGQGPPSTGRPPVPSVTPGRMDRPAGS